MDFTQVLNCINTSIRMRTVSFVGNMPHEAHEAEVTPDIESDVVTTSARWRFMLELSHSQPGIYDGEAAFTLLSGNESSANVSIAFDFANWHTENYLFMPAAVYDGNRRKIAGISYPPFWHVQDGAGPDMETTITDVPHLAAGAGFSMIHLRSGDMATPCTGIYMPGIKKVFLLFTEHITSFGYTGFKFRESDDRSSARLELEAPAVRQAVYTMCNSASISDDEGAAFSEGDNVKLRFRLILADCPDILGLYELFFEHRKDICSSKEFWHCLPLSAAFKAIEDKTNALQWNEKYRYYRTNPNGNTSVFGDWQAGWVGCGMHTLAYLYSGNRLSRERSRMTMDSVFGFLQTPKGYIQPIFHEGKRLGDDFCHMDRSVLLVRKNGDILLFAARQVMLMQSRGETAPENWLSGMRRLADAFLRLWRRHGQFGQFVDIETEEIINGGTACGSCVPGGLALVSYVLGEPDYMIVARDSAKKYYADCVLKGFINGAPGEILQNADCESAFNLLESLTILYDLTGESQWLGMAEDTAKQCASWCVSYDFQYPAYAGFAKAGIRSTGSVFANTQNKCSTPGICTLSGASLFRLYRATGDRRYLELCRDIAHNCTQYVGAPGHEIETLDGKLQTDGCMSERVNMSDWEGKSDIGGIWQGSSFWPEVACQLTYCEVPGVIFFSDTGEAIVIDHVDAEVIDSGDSWELQLSNPTGYEALVKVFVEEAANRNRPLGQCYLDSAPTVAVPAGGMTFHTIKKHGHSSV